MRIAINTRFLLANKKMEGFGWYTFEIVKRLVENHPEHEFILFFDRKYDEKFVFGKNVLPVVLSPQARHPILFYFWFEFSIRKALKKYKADIFFSPDGYLSLRSDLKQVIVIHDINFEHNPQDLPRSTSKYLRRNFPKFAAKADHILTVSDYSKQDICTTYSIPKDKVTVAWNGAAEVFKPIDAHTKEQIEKKYAKGNPYFLFVGALHPRKNVNRLIEAFTNLKINDSQNQYELIIVGEEMFHNSVNALLIPDDVRKHIQFTGHLQLEDLAEVMAGATVFTYIPYFEGFGIPLVEAMKCGTPILAGDRTSLPEVAGDAALYCDPFDVADITEKLIQISTDSKLRESLSQKGLKRGELFSWDITANKVWDVIMTVATR